MPDATWKGSCSRTMLQWNAQWIAQSLTLLQEPPAAELPRRDGCDTGVARSRRAAGTARVLQIDEDFFPTPSVPLLRCYPLARRRLSSSWCAALLQAQIAGPQRTHFFRRYARSQRDAGPSWLRPSKALAGTLLNAFAANAGEHRMDASRQTWHFKRTHRYRGHRITR